MRSAKTAGITAGLLCASAGAFAGTVNINTDASEPVDVAGISGFTTTGADMNGMLITATFLDGSSETVTWGATGDAGAGAANGTGWGLALTGDSFFNEWVLSNESGEGMSGLTIEALPGSTVLDRFINDEVSPGTSLGFSFQVDDDLPGPNNDDDAGVDTFNVLYSQPVGINGAAPLGDIWGKIDIGFLNAGAFGIEVGFRSSSRKLRFMQDTDNLLQGGMEMVPLPGTVAMAGSCLLLGATRRRRA